MSTIRQKRKSNRFTIKNIKKQLPEMHDIHGYKVFLYPFPNKTVYVEMYNNNGFISETKETSGINHLLEHVLTNAWKKCKHNKCSPYWTERGVSYNASTSETLLNYYTYGLEEYSREMLDYIINITINPVITQKMIENEHTAVQNELLRELNKRNSSLYDKFNKEFYSLEGLQYSADWKLQIDNLKKIKKETILDTFKEYYHSRNTVFMVSGDFNKKQVLDIFKKYIKPKHKTLCPVNPFSSKPCFSNNNKVIHLQDIGSKTVHMLIGFPTDIDVSHPLFYSVGMSMEIIQNILFEHLRTKLKLVYGISVTAVTNSCGVSIHIEVFVNDKSAPKVLTEIVKKIELYKKQILPNKQYIAITKKQKLNYRNFKLGPIVLASHFMNQYMIQVHKQHKKLYTIDQQLDILSKVTKENIRSIYNIIFDFKKVLIVYQSKQRISLRI